MPKFKTTIIMVVLAVLGVVAVMLTERGGREAGDADGGQRLLAAGRLPVDDVTRISIARRDEPRLVFERGATGWVQVQPFHHPMDPFSIRQLAVAAEELEIVDRLGATALQGSQSLSALSLQPADAVATFEWDGGSVELQLGRRGVAGRAYVRLSGEDDVYVVSQTLHERMIEMDPREWRDRRLFEHAGIESERIVRDIAGEPLELVRDRKRWRMAQPVQTRLDPVASEELFAALGRARSSGFVLDEPEDLGPFGLREPVATLEVVSSVPVEDADGGISRRATTERLLIGAAVAAGSEDRFGLIEGRPTVVQVPAAVVAALFVPHTGLIDPTASGVNPADIKSLRISTGQTEMTLDRDLERWIAPEHGDAPVEPARVEELLAQLTDLRAVEVDIQPYPRDLQVAFVTLHGFDGRPVDTVRIVRHPDTERWAMENGDGVLRVFPEHMSLRLTPADFGLAARAVNGEE